MGVINRYGVLYVRFKDETGQWISRSTGLRSGQEDEAQALYQEEVERVNRQKGNHYNSSTGGEGSLNEGTKASPTTRTNKSKVIWNNGYTPKGKSPTVAAYVTNWHTRRRGLGVITCDEHYAILQKYLIPEFGDVPLDQVRPRHIIGIIEALRTEGRLAPRTIHSIYGVMRKMFKDAMVDEHILQSPCILDKHHLGVKRDKNPTWREGARFDRDELLSLITDRRIPLERRVLYAVQGLAGLRHGEAAGLKWGSWNRNKKPLGELSICASYERQTTKTGVARKIPVHPCLEKILKLWWERGWQQINGRAPSEDDLIIPFRPSDSSTELRMRSPNSACKNLRKDLQVLGMRARRDHDLRRTFISMAREDGARTELLKVCTHGQSKDIMDIYTSFSWRALCGEVSKLKFPKGDKQAADGERYGDGSDDGEMSKVAEG